MSLGGDELPLGLTQMPLPPPPTTCSFTGSLPCPPSLYKGALGSPPHMLPPAETRWVFSSHLWPGHMPGGGKPLLLQASPSPG